jgi:predicted DNA-binding transcriptional regulator YafY
MGTTTRPSSPSKKERGVKVGLDRFEKILRLARRRTGATMEELKTELEVSQASVKRDITFLRNRMGCPIDWDSKRQRYFVRELPGGGRYELPGLWFDASEVFALLTMVHLVEGVEPGLLVEQLAPMKERLRAILAAGGKSAAELESKVKLIHFAPRKVEPKHFRTVATALLEGKQLSLRYLRRDKQEHTERVISPLQLVHYRENWLVDAWCHLRKGLRSFALEAIEEVTALDRTAVTVSREELRAHFQSGYGIFAGKANQRAVMKFTPTRAQWVSLETWHPDQTSRFVDDGSYELEVPYSNDEELVMDLLRYGPDVEVLAPPELRARMLQKLCAAAEKYR